MPSPRELNAIIEELGVLKRTLRLQARSSPQEAESLGEVRATIVEAGSVLSELCTEPTGPVQLEKAWLAIARAQDLMRSAQRMMLQAQEARARLARVRKFNAAQRERARRARELIRERAARAEKAALPPPRLTD
jgi:hypothetical protein